MRLLIITQKVDIDDDLLGFFVRWVEKFSKYYERVFVITLAKGRYELPSNVEVYSLGKENKNSKISQAFRYLILLLKLVPKSDGVFAHMSPIFAITSWPLAKIFNKRIILWYLHRSRTFKLKVASILSNYIVTASKESLDIKGNKIIEVGHGIDVKAFAVDRNWYNSLKLSILVVGRISPIKNYETLIQAANILRSNGVEFQIKIVGRPVMPRDFEYFGKIKNLIEKLELNNVIELVGFVPYSQIPNYYKEADICINLTPKGGIDKTALEGMASGVLAIVSNEVFGPYFGDFGKELIFKENNYVDLSNKIENIVSLTPEKKEEISKFLVESV